jgi:hypothetical protein
MPLLVHKRDAAEKYQVKAEDTLESIAKAKCPDLGWKVLAAFNWGTDISKEIIRAMAETIGVKTAHYANQALWAKPEKIEFQPDKDLPAPVIRIPIAWKRDKLETDKEYKLKVRRIRPVNAISITELDKWFIPNHEKCNIGYSLEGSGDRATKVQLDVFGSNYCECTDWNNGLGTYGNPADLVDEALYVKKDLKAKEHDGDTLHWEGDVTTEKGMLGRKTGAAPKRHINVAFSPYTVHFRYWKSDGDKDASVILEPFWPLWEETKSEPAVTAADFAASPAKFTWSNAADQDAGVLEIFDATGQRVHYEVLREEKLKNGEQNVTWNKSYREDALNGKFERTYIDDSAEPPNSFKKIFFRSTPYKAKITTVKLKLKDDSLKIKWEIKKTSKLKRGLLQITDCKGKLVFQKPLPEGKLSEGKQEFAWDGKFAPEMKNTKNGDEAIPEEMPYRVQIQAHTDISADEGLALAAMHSEVRLYVHKENYRPKDIRYDSWTAKPSLALAQGPLVPGDPPGEGDGTRWFRYKLAEYGFHPGPVTDRAAADAEYKIALREFKRSVPADGSVAVPDFTRLRLDGNNDEAENDETKNAIKKIRETDKRKPFGSYPAVLSNNNDPDVKANDIDSLLPDTCNQMIVWVDDRQYYTQAAPKDENNDNFLNGSNERIAFGLKNYRGGMVNSDGKVATDAGAIARPWVPLQVDLPLLGRADDLYVAYNNAKVQVGEELKSVMRRAIGPLRVDWTFEELPPDLSTIDVSQYDTRESRSRKYVAWAIDQNKASHNRVDSGKPATYTNCLETLGGIRPSVLASYYEKVFGTDDLSLAPWRGKAVGASESVATVVHDHIAAAQTAGTDLFEHHLGKAGVYFHPSTIAGDGYRIRAEVNPEKFQGYEFPNLDILKMRYASLPHAHSARLRIWRRSSVRGYMCWASAASGHWPNMINRYRELYRAAYVYFVHEGGVAPQAFNITDVFDPADNTHQARYKNICKNNMSDADLKDISRMKLRGDDLWPWGHRDDLGWEWRSDEGIAFADLYDRWISPTVITMTWREFRDGLLIALVKQVEKRGFLRGHLFVEFNASPSAFVEEYKCFGAGGTEHNYWYIKKSGATSNPDSSCPAPGCARTLRATGMGQPYADGLPLPAVGVALGATWLFTNPANAETWAHEVGHHRHAEHAASAPGAEATLHDSEDNTTQNWAARHVAEIKDQHWDRMCIMSYASPPNLYFCGRCILRNRGWKVKGLGFPGVDIAEPS